VNQFDDEYDWVRNALRGEQIAPVSGLLCLNRRIINAGKVSYADLRKERFLVQLVADSR